MRVSEGGICGRFEAHIRAEPMSKMVSVGGRGARGLICAERFVNVREEERDTRSSDASALDFVGEAGVISFEEDVVRDADEEGKGDEALGGEEALVVGEGEEALGRIDGEAACGMAATAP